MKQWKREFDKEDRDTCMAKWTFNLTQDDGPVIIESIDILRVDRGCQGHPKTITALIKNTSIDSINIDELSQASCSRGLSCGQMLAECLDVICKEG